MLWRKVVLSVWVVRGKLGFVGVVIGALCWQRMVVLSVWEVVSELGLMGWLLVHCFGGERWF